MLLDEMRARLKEFEARDEEGREYEGLPSGDSDATAELKELLHDYERRCADGTEEWKKAALQFSRRFEAWKKKHCGVAE